MSMRIMSAALPDSHVENRQARGRGEWPHDRSPLNQGAPHRKDFDIVIFVSHLLWRFRMQPSHDYADSEIAVGLQVVSARVGLCVLKLS